MSYLIDKIPKTLRWMLSPVASLLSFIIVHVIVNLLGKVAVFLSPEGWGIHMFEYAIAPFMAGQYGIKGFLSFIPGYSRPWIVVMSGVYFFVFGAFSFVSAYTGVWSSVLWAISAAGGVIYFLNTESD